MKNRRIRSIDNLVVIVMVLMQDWCIEVSRGPKSSVMALVCTCVIRTKPRKWGGVELTERKVGNKVCEEGAKRAQEVMNV
jgi:hypothetical protein